jgi:hypothetical protein
MEMLEPAGPIAAANAESTRPDKEIILVIPDGAI